MLVPAVTETHFLPRAHLTPEHPKEDVCVSSVPPDTFTTPSWATHTAWPLESLIPGQALVSPSRRPPLQAELANFPPGSSSPEMSPLTDESAGVQPGSQDLANTSSSMSPGLLRTPPLTS